LRQAATAAAPRLDFAVVNRRKMQSLLPLVPQRNATLSVGSLLRSSYLLYFSQPAADRALYKAVQSRPVRSIVELGVRLADRTPRLLEVAAWRNDCLPLRYTGIDLFEGRTGSHRGPSLKQTHAALRLPGARVQLVPGDPLSALARVANSLGGTDLVVISADQDRESLAVAWSWLPRMLTADSLVFLEEPAAKSGSIWRRIPLAEVQQRAIQAGKLRSRAA
jgi:hypothetical protein